jgi:hypothetical protein
MNESEDKRAKRGGERTLYVPRGRRELNEKKYPDEERKIEEEHVHATPRSTKISSKEEGNKKTDGIVTPKDHGEVTERTLYVPRGRRELNEKKKIDEERTINSPSQNTSSKEAGNKKSDEATLSKEQEDLMERRRLAFFSEPERTAAPSSSSANYSRDDNNERYTKSSVRDLTDTVEKLQIDDDEFRDFISDEKLATFCLIIESLPFDLTDVNKQQIIRPYEEAGGLSSWITPRDCLLVYLNEPQARRGQSVRCTHRAKSLEDSDLHYTATVLAGKSHLTLTP